MKNKISIPAAAILIIAFASCSHKDEEHKTPPPKKVYKAMAVQMREISGNVQLPGLMQPFEFVQLYAKVNGFVKNVLVDRGTVVKKGQVLLTLEAPEILQQVAAAKLKYTQAQSVYITSRDRYRRLLETSKTPGTVSPFDLEAAAAQKQGDSATAQGEYANYQAAQTMQSYLTVRATFDGIITERNVHPGALAGPGTANAKPMLILQQLSRLRLTVDIPEQYVTQVKDGNTVQYRVNALPGQDFTGTIARSSESLSNNYRSETIEIDVPNSGDTFKPGMYAEVILPTSGSANAYVVPKSAVVTTTERKYVVKLNHGIARWVDISEGNQSTDSTEVFGNLSVGDSLVTNASYQIKDGSSIR
jgi:RND family efflux transporter MFP subunit